MSEDLSQEVAVSPWDGEGLCAYIWTGLGQVPDLWLGDRLVCQPTLASWDGGCSGGSEEWGLERCTALTRAERTAKCHIVSLSLLLCLILLFSRFASSCLHISPQFITKQDHDDRSVKLPGVKWVNLWFVLLGVLFLFFQMLWENPSKH